MSEPEDDTYDRLGKLFLRYIKAEDKWRGLQSERKYYEVQRCLREIRNEAKLRSKEIHDQMKEQRPKFFERQFSEEQKRRRNKD